MAVYTGALAGPVMPIGDGYGFNITAPNHRPLLTLAYHTQREADVARDAVAKALDPAALREVSDQP
jgi:hypothetical protein